MAGELFEGLTIRIGADTKKLQSALVQVDKKAAAAQKTLRKLNAALKMDSTRVAAVDEKLAASGDAAVLAATKVRKLERAIAQTGATATQADPSKTLAQLASETQNAFARAQRLTEEYNQLDETIRHVKQDIAASNGLSMAEAQGMSEQELNEYVDALRKANSLTDAQSSKLIELKERWHQVAAQQQDALAVTRIKSATAEVEKQRAQVAKLTGEWKSESAAYRAANESAGMKELTEQAKLLGSRIEETTSRMKQLATQSKRIGGASSDARAEFLKLNDVMAISENELGTLSHSISTLKSRLGGIEGKSLLELETAAERAGQAASETRADCSMLEGELSDLKTQASELRGQFDRLEAAGESIAEVSAEMKKLDTRIEETTSDLAQMQAKAKAADEAFANGQLRADIKKVEKRIQAATDKLGTFTTKAQATSKSFASMAYNVRSVGTALSATTSVLGSMALYEMIDAADEIDSAYRDMRKTVEATEEEYEELKDTAVEFSQTHVTDAATVLEIEAMGGQLGIAAESLDEFATVISNLDVATDIDAEDAAEMLGKLANITEMTEDDYSNFGDSLVRLGNNFAAMESDIMNITTRFGSQASIVGMSTDEMLGWATAASATGMKAEAAGSSMNRTIGKVEKAVSAGGDALDGFAEVAGMSADEFADAWESAPSDALQAFVEGLERVDDEGGSVTTTLSELGITNVRDVQLLEGLAQSTDTLSDALVQSADAWATGDDAEEEAEKKAEGFSGQLSILQNNVQVLAAEMGESLAPALGAISDIVLEVTDAWGQLDESQQQSVLETVAVIAALGPVMTVGGALGQVVGRVADKFDTASVSMLKGKDSAWKAQRGLQGVETAAELAAAKQGLLGVQSKNGAKQLKLQATKATLCNGALTALKGGAVIAAAALATYLIAKVVEAEQEQQEFNDALERSEEAVQTVSGSCESTEDDMDDVTVSIRDARDAWDEFRDAQDEAVDEMEGYADDYTDTCTAMNAAKEAIEDYMGVTGLSTVEQGKLVSAVETLNSVSEDEYEVIDAANGIIGKMGETAEEAAAKTDEYKQSITELIDAAKDEARIEALSNTLTTLYEEQADAANTVATLQQALVDAVDENGVADAGYWEIYDDLENAKTALDTVNGQIESTANLLGSASEEAEELSEKAQKLQGFLGGEDSAEYMTFENILANKGYTVQDFCDALTDAGFRVQDLSTLTSDELTSMAAAFDDGEDTIVNSFFDIVYAFESGNEDIAASLHDAGVSYEDLAKLGGDNLDALAKACDDDVETMTAVLEALGDITLEDKTFTVSAGGTLKIAGGELSALDSASIEDKGFEVTENGTVKATSDAIEALIDKEEEIPDEVTTEVSVKKSSTFDSVIASIKAKLKSLINRSGGSSSKYVDVTASGSAAHARGGYVIPRHAAGGYASVPRYAGGAIFTAETLTRHGYVGEAGAEAIVPLTNRRYAQPFIDMLANGLVEQGGTAAGNVTNVYLGNVQAAPESEVYAATLALVEAANVTAQRRS